MSRIVFGVLATGCVWATTGWAQSPSALEPIDIQGEAPAAERQTRTPAPGAADTAAALRDVPNGALLDNGGISGQTQYRGSAGYRNAVRIDGMGVTSGGPNWMDPPLHYAPAALVDDVTVTRGLSSVADSVDQIGAVIDAKTDRGQYGDNDQFELGGRLSSTVRSVNNSHSVGGRAQLANEHNKIGLSAVTDQASDTKTPLGRIRASSYDRRQYGLDFGKRWSAGGTTGFVRHQDTGRTGTPALPLDIEFFDTTLAQLGRKTTLGDTTVDARISFNDVDHQMRNDTLREAPDFSPLNGGAPDRRLIDASSRGYTAELDLGHPAFGGTLSGGLDLRYAEHDARVRDPDNAMFFVDAFDDIRRETYSVYGQWAGPLAELWTGEAGLRYTRVVTDAGDGGVAPGLPQPARNVATDFAAADKRRSDDNIDLVAKLTRTLTDEWSVYAGLARKTRSPHYVERYAYIPLEATAGLADGNNHIGDIDLDPEVAYEINLGTDFEGQRLSFSPQLFYRRVNDYITGVAVDDTPGTIDSDVERVSNVNGDPTPLRYANVDAELYGADIAAAYAINDAWRLDAGAGYTRGKRRDTDDDLYRIAPANLRAGVTWQDADWRVSLTQRYIFEQNHVSRTHADARLGEPETAGYALTDIAASYRVRPSVTVTAGLDNLFDKGYRDFLAGYNRATGSDIDVGQRLPGAGRNAYVSLTADF